MRSYLAANVSRIGMLRVKDIVQLGAVHAVLCNSQDERLMGAVMPDNPYVAYLGRSPELDGGLVTTGTGEYADTHTAPVAVSDTGFSAFPNVVGVEGDMIWNCFGGIGDMARGGNSGVLAWKYTGSHWWPVLLAASEPPAP